MGLHNQPIALQQHLGSVVNGYVAGGNQQRLDFLSPHQAASVADLSPGKHSRVVSVAVDSVKAVPNENNERTANEQAARERAVKVSNACVISVQRAVTLIGMTFNYMCV